MTDGQGRQQARAAIEMGSPAEPRAVAAERVDGSRRVATIVVAFALTLAALSAVIVHWTWAVGVSAGRDLFPYRMVLAQTEPSRGPVDLVWLGDSTITSLPSRTSYADTLLRTFAPHDVRTALVAWPGLDFFGYYAVMPRILALQPRVLVMIANFRLFARTGWAYTDLLGSMPLGEVPRLWTLPYDRRGTSAAEMLLARALRWPAVTNAMFYVQGVRGIADRLPIRNDLGPAVPEMPDREMMRRALDATLHAWIRPFGTGDPMLEMVHASVERATENGTRVLVIVSPMPVYALRREHLYDERRWDEQIAAVREAIETGGGTLLDLHDTLSKKDFRDLNGHFTDAGDRKMLNLTAPAVIRALIDAGVAKPPPATASR